MGGVIQAAAAVLYFKLCSPCIGASDHAPCWHVSLEQGWEHRCSQRHVRLLQHAGAVSTFLLAQLSPFMRVLPSAFPSLLLEEACPSECADKLWVCCVTLDESKGFAVRARIKLP